MDKSSGNENDEQIVDDRTETDIESEPTKVTKPIGSQSPAASSIVTAPASPRHGQQQQHTISESTVVTAAATACS